MAMSNAEKQARFRDRNVVHLTAAADDIAAKLIAMDDQNKLRKVVRYVKDHLRHPDRDATERAIALGLVGMNDLDGPLSKTEMLKRHRSPELKPDHSWRVEASTQDGKRWQNGVRLETKKEAEAYIEAHVRYDLEKHGYVTAKIVRCDDEANCSVIRRSRKGRPTLVFPDGQCTILRWTAAED
jgi:hypothetical protein